MFVAHLPAGYISARLLAGRLAPRRISRPLYLGTALAGAVFPDLDLLYGYFVDARRQHHHRYLTHLPLCWIAVLATALLWWRLRPGSRAAPLVLLFSLNGFIHLLLDSVVGDIWWLAPLVDRPYGLFHVPALYQPWWLNFLCHWTFALELGLLAWALWLWQAGCTSPRNPG